MSSFEAPGRSFAFAGQTGTPQKFLPSASLSFSPCQNHTFPSQSSFFIDQSFSDVSEETAAKIATMQAKLNQKLGPEYISQRPGPGGTMKLTYAEGWKIINLANEVFGFNGWSSSIVSLTTDFADYNEESRRFNVGVTAIIRVTLRDGTFHEDVGYGVLENSKTKGAAFDKCKKEAVTDGVKRALRNFGNLLGNCLYDKSYTQEVVKIKVPPPKFEKDALYRKPEYDPELKASASTSYTRKSKISPNASTSSTTSSKPQSSNSNNYSAIKTEQKPLTSIPPHIRSEMSPTTNQLPKVEPFSNNHRNPPPHLPHTRIESASTNTTAVSTPLGKGKTPETPTLSAAAPKLVAAPQPAAAATSNLNLPTRNLAPPPTRVSPPQPKVSPPAAERSVSFAATHDTIPQPIIEDESFTFGSDDEAFFATVDLGEGDLGRPIDFDEGTGGVSPNMSESELTGSGSMVAQGEQGRYRTTSDPTNNASGGSRADSASGPSRGNAQNNISRNQQQQQRMGNNNGAYTGSSNNNNAPARLQNQNVNPASSNNPSAQGASRRLTMGGFHFPPGVTPAVGVKRSADTMQTNSSANRRPVQGMGLAPPAPNGRQPLSRLELGEGGDVKRVKR